MVLGSLAAAASTPAPQYRIIDPHVHVWIDDPRYPWAKETKTPPEKDATPEMLLALMKANNVARTVLVQVIYYRWDNRYVADVLKKYPARLSGCLPREPGGPRGPRRSFRACRARVSRRANQPHCRRQR